MKDRNDFVSNSSSSSFIVITDSGAFDAPRSFCGEEVTLPNAELGQAEFGWQTERYGDFWSKLNWCAIVISDKRDMEKGDGPDEELKGRVMEPWYRADEMERNLKEVCAELGYDVSVRQKGEDECEWDYGYIDHQSAIFEDPSNARMFKTKKALRDFLTNSGSYVDNSNDNGGRDDDEWDDATGRYSSQPEDYYKVGPAEPAPSAEIETGAYGDILKEF